MLPLDERFSTLTETQDVIAATVDAVFDVVCSTMGPNGRLVVIQEGTSVKTTKDGATVAKALEFENKHQDKICQIIAQSAVKTELECGDGTTTTIFLTKLFYHLFKKYPGYINRVAIEKQVNNIIDKLKEDTIRVTIDDEALRQVATITANQDSSIVDTVLECYRKYDNPLIITEEGKSKEDVISADNGLKLRMSISTAAFTANKNGSPTSYKNLKYVVVNDNFIDSGTNPDLVFATLIALAKRYPDDKIGLVVNQGSNTLNNAVLQVNSSLIHNNMKTEFVVFTTNSGGSIGSLIMGDIATVLNAPFVNGLNDIQHINLVESDVTVVGTLSGSSVTELTSDTKARIDLRVADIKRTLDEMNSSNRFSPVGLITERRLQELLGQVVTVFVGGETLSDIQERKDRFDDVGLAVKSALINGILPGCGVALRDAAYHVLGDVEHASDLEVDVSIVCFEQFGFLTENVVNGVNKNNLSSAAQIKTITDLSTGYKGTPEELGVYDTAYASITALKGAVTTAKILANTSSIVMSNRLGALKY